MSPDIVLTIASLILVVSPLPMVLKRTKVPLAAALLTAVGITGIIYGDLLLSLWFAASVTACNAVCWWLLVARR